MSHPSPNRRYTIRLLTGGAVVLAISFLLNTWVNPLWVSPAPWSDPDFADYKPIHKHPRTGKAGLTLSGDLEAIVVGSSRLDIAVDPSHPLWKGRKASNLSLRGGNLTEFAPLVRYALERNPVRTLILGVDHYDLTSPIDIPNAPAFAQSPLAETDNELERTIRNHIGGSTTEMSIKALNYRARGRLASYNRFGQWIHSLDGRPFRAIYLTDSLPQAVQWIEGYRRDPSINPEKISALRSILRDCSERDVEVTILIPPNHATYLSNFFDDADSPGIFATNRNAVHEVVVRHQAEHPEARPIAIWDFCDFHPINCEPLPPEGAREKMEHWIDGTHATAGVGALMLHCALGDGPVVPEGTREPYGTRIDARSLDATQAALERGFERYRREHPEDLAWARKKLRELTGTR